MPKLTSTAPSGNPVRVEGGPSTEDGATLGERLVRGAQTWSTVDRVLAAYPDAVAEALRRRFGGEEEDEGASDERRSSDAEDGGSDEEATR